MIESFSEIPESVRVFLDKYLSEKDKIKSKEMFVYMLRMFWQSRYDKMNSSSKENFDWLSQHFLPENVVYSGVQLHTNLISSDLDHTKLASDVFEHLYALKYPVFVVEKQSFLNKISSLFKSDK